MIILGLDLATKTGWALGKAGARPSFGTVKLPKTGDDIGAFLLAYSEWFRPFLLEHKPQIVCFEAPLFLLRGNSQMATAMKLMGLASTTELIIAHLAKRGMSVRCFQAHQQEWKKHFTGFANFSKKRDPYPPIEACQERGWWVQSSDEADACGVWDYAGHIACPELARSTDPIARGIGW